MTLNELNIKIAQVLKEKFKLADNFPVPSLSASPSHIDADLSCSWAMQSAKLLKKSPAEIAKSITDDLQKIEGIVKVTVSPPGFINLTLNETVLLDNYKNFISDTEKYNKSETASKEKILIEFVSANPTGPLHIASGRGASIGDSLSNIFEELGHRVLREYYVNDTGTQARLLGVSLKARHMQSELPENGYQGEYLIELAKKIPKNAKFTDEDYSKFAIENLLSLHKKDMSAFNVKFDNWFRESALHYEGAVNATLEFLNSKSKTYKKDGAVWFGTYNDKDAEDRVLVRKDKHPTYFLSDLTYHKNKYDRGFDTLIDVWGADHHGYVARMQEGLKAMGFKPESFKVILHQFVHLSIGGKVVQMSKRSGRFETLKNLIDEVGVDACRFFFALRSPNSHLTFDTELAKKKTQENPVYYVQYVHARICSILSNAKEQKIKIDFNPDFKDIKLCKEERALLSKLFHFNNVLQMCVKDLSPHHLANYLTEFAGLFHPFYDKCKVLDETNAKLTRQRLFICRGVQIAIKKGLNILGVSVPERM